PRLMNNPGQGVVVELPLAELGEQPADVLVDVLDHAVEVGAWLGDAEVEDHEPAPLVSRAAGVSPPWGSPAADAAGRPPPSPSSPAAGFTQPALCSRSHSEAHDSATA